MRPLTVVQNEKNVVVGEPSRDDGGPSPNQLAWKHVTLTPVHNTYTFLRIKINTLDITRLCVLPPLVQHPLPQIYELLQARVTCHHHYNRSEKILPLSPFSCPKPASTISGHHHHHHSDFDYVSSSAFFFESSDYITLPSHHIALARTTSNSLLFYYPSKQPSRDVAQYELEEAQGDRYRVR